jgi:1-acyl-sn-glycerol-3-phosphate acyltransferase
VVDRELKTPPDGLPTFSPRLQRLFAFYVRGMMRRSFRAVRLAYADRPQGLAGTPLLVYANHPSWWDPLLAQIVATTLFRDRRHYSPIDAAALEKYAFFRRLGYFGVEQNSRKGAAMFLRTGERILSVPDSTLWMTPQGSFNDVRSRPVRFKSGIGHLARRAPSAAAVPFVFEYVFGEERLPEIWARFGPAIRLGEDAAMSAEEWTDTMAGALQTAQDRLAADVMARRREGYEVLLAGKAGVGGVYDLWRRAKAWARGAEFRPEHGSETL